MKLVAFLHTYMMGIKTRLCKNDFGGGLFESVIVKKTRIIQIELKLELCY